jgi:hypothetical protein
MEDEPVAKDPERCERLDLSTYTKQVLWGESGGHCQNPICGVYLFQPDAKINFAEMAHIIAATTGGPRDLPASVMSEKQRAHDSNLAVLCASCHTKVDKAPASYPESMMRQWKAKHQERLLQMFGTPEFTNRGHARDFVAPLLAQNRTIFNLYGPVRGDFSDERALQWRRHVRETVVPNNAAIDRALKQNRKLLLPKEQETADRFAVHRAEFEARHVLGDWSAGSQTFPSGMDALFEETV